MKKIESDRCFSLFLLHFLSILFFAVAVAVSAAAPTPTIVSGQIFGSTTSTSTILQVKTACPVDFEFLNYTIITSKCKGPEYPTNLCCSALTEFACPYAKYINDLSNDCATTMFSYINLYGKYPPGLFSSLCTKGSNVLQCGHSASPFLDTCHHVQKITISHVHPL